MLEIIAIVVISLILIVEIVLTVIINREVTQLLINSKNTKETALDIQEKQNRLKEESIRMEKTLKQLYNSHKKFSSEIKDLMVIFSEVKDRNNEVYASIPEILLNSTELRKENKELSDLIRISSSIKKAANSLKPEILKSDSPKLDISKPTISKPDISKQNIQVGNKRKENEPPSFIKTSGNILPNRKENKKSDFGKGIKGDRSSRQ